MSYHGKENSDNTENNTVVATADRDKNRNYS